MTNAVIECILSRSAAKYYDPAATLSDGEIRDLVRIATTAPTSFHLQNWRFIAVRTPEAKARLRPIAWNQPPITEAAVTFIVCGQLADSSVIPKRLAPVVEAGIMPARLVPDWEIPARDLYMEYPQRQRDEAVRTGTFGAAAMIGVLEWGTLAGVRRSGTAAVVAYVAVAAALAANPEVRKSRANVELLEGRGKEALADALPELNLYGTATRFRDPSLLNSPNFESFPPEFADAFAPITTNLYDGLEFAGDDGNAELLGIFKVSVLHNIVHGLFGIAGLALAATPGGARTYLVGGGAIYIALWLLGILGGADWIPSNTADDWLHLVLGVGMVGLGVALTRERAVTRTA